MQIINGGRKQRFKEMRPLAPSISILPPRLCLEANMRQDMLSQQLATFPYLLIGAVLE